MKILLTGATGYIGGTVASRLLAAGHEVTGLVRSEEGAAELRRHGIAPLRGALADRAVLADAAGRADAVINAANSDNRDIIEAVLPVLHGSGKAFIQTSGSSIVGDKAGGELGTLIYDEEKPIVFLVDADCEAREQVFYGLDQPESAFPARDIFGEPVVAPNEKTYRRLTTKQDELPAAWLHHFCDRDWTAERKAAAAPR